MSNEIGDLSEKIFEANKIKGFWDQPRNFGELLMLVTSELSEALEAHRKDGITIAANYGEKQVMNNCDDEEFKKRFEVLVKDSVQDELADAVIRLLDMSGGLGIDIQWHIEAKLRYNSLRAHKHGKKY